MFINRNKHRRPKRRFVSNIMCFLVLTSSLGWTQVSPGTMDVHWNEGSSNCASSPQPPLQVHQYNTQTFILRENLCTTFEAPFMYLLVGSSRALLIDTGDVADPNKVPLANTVMGLLSEDQTSKDRTGNRKGNSSPKLPLLVVHTHHHLDHRAGDPQFAGIPDVQVVGVDLSVIRSYLNFVRWPEGVAQIDLGNRTVDVLPTPGHNDAEISFYDRNTGLFFSGDFLMPGRLLISDKAADLGSAQRVADFVRDRPVSFVLGGHIEMNSEGTLYEWQSQYHPGEHVLQMRKEDLLALPAVISHFNGFYTVSGQFTMENSLHILIAFSVLALAIIIGFVWLLVRYIRRRRSRRRAQVTFPSSVP